MMNGKGWVQSWGIMYSKMLVCQSLVSLSLGQRSSLEGASPSLGFSLLLLLLSGSPIVPSGVTPRLLSPSQCFVTPYQSLLVPHKPTPVSLPGEAPWKEEPGRLQSLKLQRVGHDWVTKHSTFCVRENALNLKANISFTHTWAGTSNFDKQK